MPFGPAKQNIPLNCIIPKQKFICETKKKRGQLQYVQFCGPLNDKLMVLYRCALLAYTKTYHSTLTYWASPHWGCF
jgi:hypothetical protein